MICPRRSSENVQIQIVQTGGKNAHKGVGLVCHSNNSARALTAVSMLGMSNLLWKKSKGLPGRSTSGRSALASDTRSRPRASPGEGTMTTLHRPPHPSVEVMTLKKERP